MKLNLQIEYHVYYVIYTSFKGQVGYLYRYNHGSLFELDLKPGVIAVVLPSDT